VANLVAHRKHHRNMERRALQSVCRAAGRSALSMTGGLQAQTRRSSRRTTGAPGEQRVQKTVDRGDLTFFGAGAHGLQSSSYESIGQRRVPDQSQDRRRERLRVAGGNQQDVKSILYDAGHATDSGRDDRNTASHGFDSRVCRTVRRASCAPSRTYSPEIRSMQFASVMNSRSTSCLQSQA